MTTQDQLLSREIYKQVKESKLEILIMGADAYIQQHIDNLNALAPVGKTRLKDETVNKLRTIFTSCIGSILGI